MVYLHYSSTLHDTLRRTAIAQTQRVSLDFTAFCEATQHVLADKLTKHVCTLRFDLYLCLETRSKPENETECQA